MKQSPSWSTECSLKVSSSNSRALRELWRCNWESVMFLLIHGIYFKVVVISISIFQTRWPWHSLSNLNLCTHKVGQRVQDIPQGMANFYEKFNKGGIEISLKATQITLYATYIIESRPWVNCELGIGQTDDVSVVLSQMSSCKHILGFGWCPLRHFPGFTPSVSAVFSAGCNPSPSLRLQKQCWRQCTSHWLSWLALRKSTWPPLARTCIWGCNP